MQAVFSWSEIMMSYIHKSKSGLAILAIALPAGCSASTNAVEDASKSDKKGQQETAAQAPQSAETTTQQQAEPAQEAPSVTANVINKPGKVENRGGYIRMLINRQPITNFDLKRRAKFLQLRNVSGNRKKLAEQEMIEQVVKLQEARRTNSLATDEMVAASFAQFASRNRSNPARLEKDLDRLGIGADHFKEFIRTQMSWQRVVQGRFRAEAINVSERDVVTRLRKSGSDKPEVTEYNLQQVIFVVPESKRSKSLLAARKVEANAFRQQFSTCGGSVQLAKSLRDVSVVDQTRVLEPELPDGWKDEVTSMEIGATTRPRETPRGVEVIAVCDKRIVNDDRAAQVTNQSTEFSSFNEKGSEIAKGYLDELVSRATVVYR